MNVIANKTSEYWKKRFELLETASNSYGLDTYRKIEPAFEVAQRQIEKEIDSWYSRFAKNNGVTIDEARKYLTTSEMKEFKWDVQEYIQKGRENALNQQWVKELENASAKYHISRLEALKIRTQNAAEVAFGNELDEIDAMARKVYTDNYYRSIFEVQKGFNIGWDIGQVDEKKLSKIISKPWAADGKNFSERIWGQRTQLVNELHQQLTRTCVLGKPPDGAIEAIAKKFDVTKNQAGRLVMTEQAYFHAVAQKEAFNELEVEEFEIVATLDSHTSSICQEMDGQHFPMKDYEPGVTAPPFHVWCRSVTVPYFDDDFSPGERAARDAEGNTYYVPDDMTYKDWKKQHVDSPIMVDQTVKITEKDGSNVFSVDRKLVNSKEFHDKFEGVTEHKAVNESIYQESMKMLEHRDGTDYEDIIAVDAKTGSVVAKNTLSVQKGKTGFTQEQYKAITEHSGEVILLHNHPNSSRPSFKDIRTLFVNKAVKGTVAIGHDGAMHYVTKTKDDIDIDKIWKKLYNDFAEVAPNKNLAEHYALDALYELGIFKYTRR